MKKQNLKNWFILSFVAIQVLPAITRADDTWANCSKLEEKVRQEMEQAVQKQFNATEFQARNGGSLTGVYSHGSTDPEINEILTKMKGKPELDNDTRLKYNDQLVTFMHDQDLSLNPVYIKCPKDFVFNKIENKKLWKPEPGSQSRSYSEQGLSEQADLSKACLGVVLNKKNEYEIQYSEPEEYTTVSTTFGSSNVLGRKEKDPELLAITTIRKPISIKFREKTLILKNIDVMSYLHLKDLSIEDVSEHVFLHGGGATIDGRKIELESYVDNELLPAECKDFHYRRTSQLKSVKNNIQKTAIIENKATAQPAI